MNTTPYTVRQARPEEVSQVLDTLTEAFLNDPYMYKVLGEKPHLYASRMCRRRR